MVEKISGEINLDEIDNGDLKYTKRLVKNTSKRLNTIESRISKLESEIIPAILTGQRILNQKIDGIIRYTDYIHPKLINAKILPSLDELAEEKLTMEGRILVIDIETTSLKPEEGWIVEIGICELELKNNGNIIPIFNSTIKEKDLKKLDADSWIFKNSTLKIEDVLKGPDLEKVKDRLQALFDSEYVTSFNQKFDFGWLRNRGFKIPHEFLDPMTTLTDIMKIPLGIGNFKYPNVQEALEFLGIPEKEPHRALGDAMLEAKILYKMYEKKMFDLPTTTTTTKTTTPTTTKEESK